MSLSSIEGLPQEELKAEIAASARSEGFSRARFFAPFTPPEGGSHGEGAQAALVVALPYGNRGAEADPDGPGGPVARLDAFSRRDYYGETVARLKKIAAGIRTRLGGRRSDYRILCNSPVPEKPLAAACGLGRIGRNSLLITPEAGSLVVIGVLTLPFALPGDGPLKGDPCERCAACVAACPTGALGGTGDRSLDRSRCIQWYASRPGSVPERIAAHWGDRLYGCSICRDACPANAAPIQGARTERGALPAELDAAELAAADDEELAARFKGTALGMRWFGPEAIRRNARLAIERGGRLRS